MKKGIIENEYEGKILVTQKDFAFVEIEGMDEDIFVEARNVGSALHKDTVLVRVISSEWNGRMKGKVIKVLERGITSMVGTYQKSKKGPYVEIDDVRYKALVKVDRDDTSGARHDEKVKIEIKEYLKNGIVIATVTEILGDKDAPGVDILSTCFKHEITTEFSPATLEEAEAISDVLEAEDYVGRRDLRNEIIMTIDGADAKDLDDAVGVKTLDNGNYQLTVSIADVTHYIKEDSALDIEAFDRGTSVYLTDRVVPMIPKKLSNGICSLNPQVDRLTLTCQMEIDSAGKVVNHEIFPSVINTVHRMTYDDVTLILDGDESLRSQYKHCVPTFELMLDLAQVLKRKRIKRGAIEFETKEAKIKVDATGFPIGIKARDRQVSEEIIEEFMLLANETVAERFHWLKLPFIYRIHENPKQDKLLSFYKMARLFGYTIKGSKDEIHPKALQKTLEDAKGTKENAIINKMLLRTMEKARYHEESLGHFGLAAPFYTHFTSPIRRYPDLIVHRMIRNFIFDRNLDDETIAHFEAVMPEIAKHTSKKERGAIDCEREVTSMKMAEYMTQFIGEEFEGVISSVTKWGIYVEIPNTVEGLVRVDDLKDDFYDFNEDLKMLIGRRKKGSYRLGDSLKVKVKDANKAEGTIDFVLAEHVKSQGRVSGRDKSGGTDSKKSYGRGKREQRNGTTRSGSRGKRRR